MHINIRGITFDALAQHAKKILFTGASAVFLMASSLAISVHADPEYTDSSGPNQGGAERVHSGTFLALSPTGEKLGECPLEHTSVDAKISGYVASVTVKQEFRNPYKKKIEAIYAFPLSDAGAVDGMTMNVNGSVIHGKIKTRDEASKTYVENKAADRIASLLHLEAHNTFTQSVANIEPGKPITTTIHYVEMLPYETGRFTFKFPLAVESQAPRVTPTNARAGDGVSIKVDIEAGTGLSVAELRSPTSFGRSAKDGAQMRRLSPFPKSEKFQTKIFYCRGMFLANNRRAAI